MVSGSKNGSVHVRSADSGECEAALAGDTEAVRALAVLPDGRIVIGSVDKPVLV
jgi:hypothetical protein